MDGCHSVVLAGLSMPGSGAVNGGLIVTRKAALVAQQNTQIVKGYAQIDDSFSSDRFKATYSGFGSSLLPSMGINQCWVCQVEDSSDWFITDHVVHEIGINQASQGNALVNRKIGVIGLVSLNLDDSISHLGLISINLLDFIQRTMSGSNPEAREGCNTNLDR